MRRFEEQYRISEGDDVLNRENAIHQDVDLRLDAVEQLGQAFAEGNRADIEAILASLEQTFSGLAAEMRGLLDQTVGGLSADIVVETAARYFLTDARRAAILADVRGGVDGSADTLAKLLGKIAEAAAGRVSKSGDTLSGPITLKYAWPNIDFYQVGGSYDKSFWRVSHHNINGNYFFQLVQPDGTNQVLHQFGRSGEIISAQFGDLKTYVDKGVRIEPQSFASGERQQARNNLRILGGGFVYGAQTIPADRAGQLFYLDGAAALSFALPDIGLGETIRLYNNDTQKRTINCIPGGDIINENNNVQSLTLLPYENIEFYRIDGKRYVVTMRSNVIRSVPNADTAQAFSDTQKRQLLANADIVIPHGQCRLNYVSATQIRLDPFNGNKIFINGNYRTIPAAGVTLSNAALGANVLSYIYAYMTSGTMSLIASSLTPITDPVYGHKIPSNGDGNYVLVGMIRTDGNAQFRDELGTRFVASWYNRRKTRLAGTLTQGGSSGSTDFVPLGNNLNGVTWGDIPVELRTTGYAFSNQANCSCETRCYIDGAGVGFSTVGTSYTNAAYVSAATGSVEYISEGFHYFNAFGKAVAGGVSTWNVQLNVDLFI